MKANLEDLAHVYNAGAEYRNDMIAWESKLIVTRLPDLGLFQVSMHTKSYDDSGCLTSQIDELSGERAEIYAYFPHWQAYVLRLQNGKDFPLLHLRVPAKVFARQTQGCFEADVEFYRQTFVNHPEGQVEVRF